MMKRRVLIVANVARHIASFHVPHILRLLEQGYEVHLACNMDQDQERLSGLSVTLHHVPFSRALSSPSNVAALFLLCGLVRRNGYSLIHCHTPIASFLTRLAAWLLSSATVIYSVHGFHFHGQSRILDWVLFYSMEWLAALWTDVLVVTNHEDYKTAKKLPVRRPSNVVYVPGVGLDLSEYAAAPDSRALVTAVREGWGLGPDDVVVGCVAEFAPVKDHELLISAWHKVSQVHPRARLVLVGEGKLLSHVRQQVTRLGVGASVIFAGYRRDVPTLLQLFDIVVLVSKREGLPRCMLEAMAASKPLIGTDIRGIRELVVPHQTGILIKTRNADELSKAMCRLIQDPSLRREFGQRSTELVRKYSIQDVLIKLDEIYAMAFSGGRV